jgi:hypothetical protein
MRHPGTPAAAPAEGQPRVVIGLNAAIVAMQGETPEVLVVRHQEGDGPANEGLPFGPFEPLGHRTMEIGLRRWVEAQTQLALGYVEQLYTFADRGRHAAPDGEEPHVVSVGYLALTRHAPLPQGLGAEWRSWYRYCPWEDRRKTAPAMIHAVIEPLLDAWAAAAGTEPLRLARRERASLCFGLHSLGWTEEQALERYELLYEAGLIHEARRDRPGQHGGMEERLVQYGASPTGLGEPMIHDHRRILATAMSRLRGKLKYRPLVFELMPAAFTLLELQRTVEAVSGIRMHKQNFRRLLARTGLVEPTGRVSTKTGGRPAEQFRFRREVLAERPAPGVRVPAPRRTRG